MKVNTMKVNTIKVKKIKVKDNKNKGTEYIKKNTKKKQKIILYISLVERKTKEVLILSKFLPKNIKLETVDWKTIKKNDERLENADLILIRSVYDYMDYFDKFESFLLNLKKYSNKIYNDLDIIRNNVNKKYLLNNKKFVPDFRIINKGNKNKNKLIFILNKLLKFHKKIVLKPLISNSGKDTQLIDKMPNDNEILKIQDIILKKGLIIQKYLSGISEGEYSIININNLRYIIKKKNEKDFRIHPNFGGKITFLKRNKDNLKFYNRLLKFENLIMKNHLKKFKNKNVLYSRTDVVLDKNKLYLIEIEMVDCVLFMNDYSAKHFCNTIKNLLNNRK